MLAYQEITISRNQATVVLLESNQLSYPGSSEPTELGNLKHTITLKKNARGVWRITKDDYLDDTLRMDHSLGYELTNCISSSLLRMSMPPHKDEGLMVLNEQVR